jgi:uncharacterized protein YndB with AHSA1/START domain
MTENTTLRMERTFQAPAQAVFDALDQRGGDPALVARRA